MACLLVSALAGITLLPSAAADCTINLGSCNNGNCTLNMGSCDGDAAGNGGSCTVNMPNTIATKGNCNGYQEWTWQGNGGSCSVNDGDCSGSYGPGGSCGVNMGTCTNNGTCAFNAWPAPYVADGPSCSNGSCTINDGDCVGEWGTGGSCIVNYGSCDGANGPDAHGGSCVINTGDCSGYGGTGGRCVVNTGVPLNSFNHASCDARQNRWGGDCTVNVNAACDDGKDCLILQDMLEEYNCVLSSPV
jgi:hypothetical protein